MIGILIIIISTQGILNYFLLSKIGLGRLKGSLFEIGTIFIIISFIIRLLKNSFKIKLSKIDFIIIFYMTIQFIPVLAKSVPIIGVIYSFKEVWLFFLFVIIYKNYSNTIKKNSNIIIKLLAVLTVLNFIAMIISFIVGSENYMQLLTNRYFYPRDPELGFKISHIGGILRTPALLGESAAFGYFSVMSFIIFDINKNKKMSMISIINTVMCLTRSAYVFIIIYLLLRKLTEFKFNKKFSIRSIFIFTIVICIIIISRFAFSETIDKFINTALISKSLDERFIYWDEIKNADLNNNISDMLIGGGYGITGTAFTLSNTYSENSMLGVFDNTWLFMYYNTGIIGVFLILVFFITMAIKNINVLYIIVPLAISMIFINMFQGIAIISLLPIAIIFAYNDKQYLLGEIINEDMFS